MDMVLIKNLKKNIKEHFTFSMSTDEQRTYMKYESTPGWNKLQGREGECPPDFDARGRE